VSLCASFEVFLGGDFRREHEFRINRVFTEGVGRE
jgi:hypothetical protein